MEEGVEERHKRDNEMMYLNIRVGRGLESKYNIYSIELLSS